MKKQIKLLIHDIFSMEMIEYMIVGVFTVIIDIGSFELAFYLVKVPSFMQTTFAHCISWVFSTTFAFFANKIFVFKSRHAGKRTFVYEFATFYSSRLFSMIVSLVLLLLMIDLGDWDPFWSKVLANIFVIITNYVFAKLLIFKRKEQIKEETENNMSPAENNDENIKIYKRKEKKSDTDSL